MKFQNAPKDQPIPITPAQEFMHAMQLLAHENIVCFWRWEGRLDIALLTKAVTQLITETDLFQCAFEQRDGKIVHVKYPMDPTLTPVHSHEDLCALIPLFNTFDYAAQVDAIMRYLKVQKTYTLNSPPLFDMFEYRCDDSTTYLVLSIAHIIFDGASAPSLFHRLRMIYQAIESKQAMPVLTTSVDYLDYAYSFNQSSQAEATLNRNLQWFEDYLAPTTTALPKADRHEVTTQSEEILHLVDPVLVKALRQSAKTYGVSLNVILLATLGLTLYGEVRQSSTYLAVVFNGRIYPELKSMLGLLIKLAYLKIDTNKESNLSDFVNCVAGNHMQALLHSDLSFVAASQLGQRHPSPIEGLLGHYVTTLFDPCESIDNILANRWVGDINKVKPGELMAFDSHGLPLCLVRYLVSDQHMGIHFEFSRALYSATRSREFISNYLNVCEVFAKADSAESVKALIEHCFTDVAI